jgi:hypothetical protein
MSYSFEVSLDQEGEHCQVSNQKAAEVYLVEKGHWV